MELKDKLKQVEELLALPITTYTNRYRIMYREIFGSNWGGCTCKIGLLREALKSWYMKNKEEYDKLNTIN